MKTNYLDTIDDVRLRANKDDDENIYDDSSKSSFDKLNFSSKHI